MTLNRAKFYEENKTKQYNKGVIGCGCLSKGSHGRPLGSGDIELITEK